MDGPAPPVLEALRTDPDALRERTARLAAELDGTVVPHDGRVGGGGGAEVPLPGWAISLEAELAGPLRTGDPALVTTVHGGQCLLDLRCLPAERRGRIRVETTGVVDLGALTPESPARLPWRAVTGEEAPLRSPAWERPPRHARHVLVCRGPRCNAQGAAEVAAALAAEFRAQGVLDDGVLLTATGCLFPCNRAPVVVVHPGPDDPDSAAGGDPPGTLPALGWHGPIRPQDVPALVRDRLAPT